ncbi:hypothetical protein RO3G_13018 [Lichtheimia corymbifera JMRC:FSU:9682]|uniref:Pyridoxamine 5'-phosphate oxidase Alr4036 family FMN-binding domain-containing protein n=1 Tax=Lichtheimia corymbifera JMRC:FSU:9682 TaxID=1263082 RepID=A0A068RG44_9FUNG|nr:hypothetical protein RO3G_13018 [Lichtheimia corymbifera JMRC:FSU:9682]
MTTTPRSPSSPTSPTLASATPPPWFPMLKKSYTKNFLYAEDPVFLTMSNIKRSGDASMHCLQFLSFLDDDPRFLVFPLAMNDNLLMGDIKSDPNANLCWMMPKSKEYYKLVGKFYIASAPIQVTRFPPPKIPASDLPAAEFWELERRKHWKAMDDKTRATYTWPSRGEAPKADRIAFSCQSLDCLIEQEGTAARGGLFSLRRNNTAPASSSTTSPSTDQKQVIHDIAMDNFCLLAYKISEVEYYDHSSFPQRRTIYTYSLKDNRWISKDANP